MAVKENRDKLCVAMLLWSTNGVISLSLCGNRVGCAIGSPSIKSSWALLSSEVTMCYMTKINVRVNQRDNINPQRQSRAKVLCIIEQLKSFKLGHRHDGVLRNNIENAK